MTGRIIKYLLIFFAMYFLGHFIMTMAYRYGKVPTIAVGILSLVIAIFTLLKAAHTSTESLQGSLCGCFLESFLNIWEFWE